MAPPAIVQTLPYVAWILLASLAFGSLVFVVATSVLADATIGYLRFTALCAALVALVTWSLDPGLPQAATSALAIQPSEPALAATRESGLLLFAILSVAYAVLMKRRRAALVLGIVALLAGLFTLVLAALGWVLAPTDAVPFVVQLAALSIVTGGALAAIVLGHWYLVTPRISERPLVLQSRFLLAAVALQALLFVTWTTLGGGPHQTPFTSFTTGPVLLVALRGVVTIVFPIILCLMAWRTAQTRSMESATGLLYINLAAVMAGTIGAAALYVSSGILV